MKKYNLIKEDTVLLIIDIQEGLANVMKYKDQVIDNTKILLQAANLMNIPIIITEQYPKGLGHTIKDFENLTSQASIFEKISFSAYLDNIAKTIEDKGRKKIIISGMETHVCVFQTTRDLIEAGYEVYIIEDAVASRTKANYLNGLQQMKSMGAVITNTETVVFDLLKVAGTSEFKTLSKLIK